MTKLEMAHELLITLIQAGEHNNCSDTAVKYVWRVIDAMQAEAEKRSDMEQWQPDWSVAPDWAVAWTYREKDNVGIFWSITPVKNNLGFFVTGDHKSKLSTMYRFDYQGSWENSLRKRP